MNVKKLVILALLVLGAVYAFKLVRTRMGGM